MKKQVKLGELESGMVFKKGDTYAVKSEYRNTKGICESYIIGSGEMFWGGTGNPNVLKVEPIDFVEVLGKAKSFERMFDIVNGFKSGETSLGEFIDDLLSEIKE